MMQETRRVERSMIGLFFHNMISTTSEERERERDRKLAGFMREWAEKENLYS